MSHPHTVRVCHLTSVHRADDPRILSKECGTLAAAGFDVRLVTPGPVVSTPPGVTQVAVARHAGRLARFVRTIPAVYRAARAEDARIYHLHDPELLGVGVLLRSQGRAVVYDAHEDLGNQVRHKKWIPVPIRRPIGTVAAAVERSLANRLSAVVAATPAIASRFRRPRTVLVRNLARIDEFPLVTSAAPQAQRDLLIAYVGSVSEPRGAREMIRALDILGATTDVRLAIAGEFSSSSLRDELRASAGWSRVDALGWLDRPAVADLLNRARIGLVCLHPTPSYLESYPVKLFEYMASGLPVVASDFPLWRQIVESAGCGILVDPLDPAAIASAIENLLSNPASAADMGRRGRAAVERHWNWEPEGDRLVTLYRNLLAGRGP